MENVLFITNKIFIDETMPEGGVKLCTSDFIKLLSCRYNVNIFPIEFNRSLIYRIKAKMGLSVFEDYSIDSYEIALFETIQNNNINKVFLNLSDTSSLSIAIKKRFHQSVKVILCSHGNESGDFLHKSVRFKKFMSYIQRITSAWRLGRILQKELEFRLEYFDLILTVSEIENNLEYWLGAKHVFFVPRVFQPDYIQWAPVPGRVGFISDISHYPNYYGVLLLCEYISKDTEINEKFEIRLVGSYCDKIDFLIKKYPFLSYLGYLSDGELKKEVLTWMYYLNLVFYFSKGVSTKLAKGMNWGLPVLSTLAGNRGYILNNGGVVTCATPEKIVTAIKERAFNYEMAKNDRERVIETVESYKDFNKVMDSLYPILDML